METSCAVLENNGLKVPADLQRELTQASTAATAAQTALDATKAAALASAADTTPMGPPSPAYVLPPDFVVEGDGPFRPPGMRRTSQV